MQIINVSIQVRSLASRELATTTSALLLPKKVSIQVRSLASREVAEAEVEVTALCNRFHSSEIPSE